MSNTTISPTVAAAALAGVAGAMGLGVAPVGGAAALPGVAPTATAVSPVIPRGGLPVSWAGLGAGAVGAAAPGGWRQARLTVAGSFGTGASLVLQGSNDQITWTNLAGINDPVAPQPRAALYSGGTFGPPSVYAPGNGLIVISNSDASPFTYLRPVVQGGDASTLLAIAGNLNPAGCV